MSSHIEINLNPKAELTEAESKLFGGARTLGDVAKIFRVKLRKDGVDRPHALRHLCLKAGNLYCLSMLVTLAAKHPNLRVVEVGPGISLYRQLADIAQKARETKTKPNAAEAFAESVSNLPIDFVVLPDKMRNMSELQTNSPDLGIDDVYHDTVIDSLQNWAFEVARPDLYHYVFLFVHSVTHFSPMFLWYLSDKFQRRDTDVPLGFVVAEGSTGFYTNHGGLEQHHHIDGRCVSVCDARSTLGYAQPRQWNEYSLAWLTNKQYELQLVVNQRYAYSTVYRLGLPKVASTQVSPRMHVYDSVCLWANQSPLPDWLYAIITGSRFVNYIDAQPYIPTTSALLWLCRNLVSFKDLDRVEPLRQFFLASINAPVVSNEEVLSNITVQPVFYAAKDTDEDRLSVRSKEWVQISHCKGRLNYVDVGVMPDNVVDRICTNQRKNTAKEVLKTGALGLYILLAYILWRDVLSKFPPIAPFLVILALMGVLIVYPFYGRYAKQMQWVTGLGMWYAYALYYPNPLPGANALGIPILSVLLEEWFRPSIEWSVNLSGQILFVPAAWILMDAVQLFNSSSELGSLRAILFVGNVFVQLYLSNIDRPRAVDFTPLESNKRKRLGVIDVEKYGAEKLDPSNGVRSGYRVAVHSLYNAAAYLAVSLIAGDQQFAPEITVTIAIVTLLSVFVALQFNKPVLNGLVATAMIAVLTIATLNNVIPFSWYAYFPAIALLCSLYFWNVTYRKYYLILGKDKTMTRDAKFTVRSFLNVVHYGTIVYYTDLNVEEVSPTQQTEIPVEQGLTVAAQKGMGRAPDEHTVRIGSENIQGVVGRQNSPLTRVMPIEKLTFDSTMCVSDDWATLAAAVFGRVFPPSTAQLVILDIFNGTCEMKEGDREAYMSLFAPLPIPKEHREPVELDLMAFCEKYATTLPPAKGRAYLEVLKECEVTLNKVRGDWISILGEITSVQEVSKRIQLIQKVFKKVEKTKAGKPLRIITCAPKDLMSAFGPQITKVIKTLNIPGINTVSGMDNVSLGMLVTHMVIKVLDQDAPTERYSDGRVLVQNFDLTRHSKRIHTVQCVTIDVVKCDASVPHYMYSVLADFIINSDLHILLKYMATMLVGMQKTLKSQLGTVKFTREHGSNSGWWATWIINTLWMMYVTRTAFRLYSWRKKNNTTALPNIRELASELPDAPDGVQVAISSDDCMAFFLPECADFAPCMADAGQLCGAGLEISDITSLATVNMLSKFFVPAVVHTPEGPINVFQPIPMLRRALGKVGFSVNPLAQEKPIAYSVAVWYSLTAEFRTFKHLFPMFDRDHPRKPAVHHALKLSQVDYDLRARLLRSECKDAVAYRVLLTNEYYPRSGDMTHAWMRKYFGVVDSDYMVHWYGRTNIYHQLSFTHSASHKIVRTFDRVSNHKWEACVETIRRAFFGGPRVHRPVRDATARLVAKGFCSDDCQGPLCHNNHAGLFAYAAQLRGYQVIYHPVALSNFVDGAEYKFCPPDPGPALDYAPEIDDATPPPDDGGVIHDNQPAPGNKNEDPVYEVTALVDGKVGHSLPDAISSVDGDWVEVEEDFKEVNFSIPNRGQAKNKHTFSKFINRGRSLPQRPHAIVVVGGPCTGIGSFLDDDMTDIQVWYYEDVHNDVRKNTHIDLTAFANRKNVVCRGPVTGNEDWTNCWVYWDLWPDSRCGQSFYQLIQTLSSASSDIDSLESERKVRENKYVESSDYNTYTRELAKFLVRSKCSLACVKTKGLYKPGTLVALYDHATVFVSPFRRLMSDECYVIGVPRGTVDTINNATWESRNAALIRQHKHYLDNNITDIVAYASTIDSRPKHYVSLHEYFKKHEFKAIAPMVNVRSKIRYEHMEVTEPTARDALMVKQFGVKGDLREYGFRKIPNSRSIVGHFKFAEHIATTLQGDYMFYLWPTGCGHSSCLRVVCTIEPSPFPLPSDPSKWSDYVRKLECFAYVHVQKRLHLLNTQQTDKRLQGISRSLDSPVMDNPRLDAGAEVKIADEKPIPIEELVSSGKFITRSSSTRVVQLPTPPIRTETKRPLGAESSSAPLAPAAPTSGGTASRVTTHVDIEMQSLNAKPKRPPVKRRRGQGAASSLSHKDRGGKSQWVKRESPTPPH